MSIRYQGDAVPQLVESVSTMMSLSDSHSYGKSSSFEDQKKQQPVLRHQSSSFMRVCDLDLPCSDSEDAVPLSEAPTDEDDGSKKQWIGLDMVEQQPQSLTSAHISPYGPVVLEMLVQNGLKVVADDSIWTPRSATETALAEVESGGKRRIAQADGTPVDTTVRMWTGSFDHDGYGHDIPAVKSSGIVAMSADKLMALLLDSDRVKEYNKNSTGRQDIQVFRNDLFEAFQADCKTDAVMTKIMLSAAQPPLLRLVLEFLTLLHARKLRPEDRIGEGYICVCRSVDRTDDEYREPKQTGGYFGPTVVRGEILLNVHLFTEIPGYEDSKCEMTNINHLKSCMVPTFIAQQLGLSAAVSMINDIRALC
jgi:hypothetical protein